MSKQSRREFLQLSATGLAAAGAVSLIPGCQQQVSNNNIIKGYPLFGEAVLPKAKGPRVVVVGGGTSGLTMAKYLKKENPAFDVVMVEKRAMYCSCFASALWYAGVEPLDFIASHSFLDAASRNEYIFFHASCIGLDRESKILMTDQGEIKYDYLVIAPGIDYRYEKIGAVDPEVQYELQQQFPAGFILPTEFVTIKHKIDQFKGGIFVITVPAGNYRCIASPYERACIMAALFQRKKIKGKVLILDANPEVRIKSDGFMAAFRDLYADVLEYIPSVNITGIDPFNKIIQSDFDDYVFNDASIYPPVRGSKLLQLLGLMDSKSLQMEARIDPFNYHVPGDESVYVTGDSRSMPFSKSANTAMTEARYVAKLIAAKAKGKSIVWQSPQTRCYSIVGINPIVGISTETKYKYDNKGKAFGFFDSHSDENRDSKKGLALSSWAKQMYQDLFS